MPDALNNYLISQGVLGIVVIGLVWYVLQLRKDMEEKDELHRVEIAAERKLNAELNKQLLTESKQGFEIAGSVKTTLDAFLSAIRSEAR